MHRVVPQIIIENFRAGRYQGDFPAVGMFLDLTGFSNMTDALMQHGTHGAEILAGLMHGVFDPLVENIFNYGGKIVSFAGDGIMALFPMEADMQTTLIRALASAWTIQHKLMENPTRQTIYGNFHFSVRIGVAVGDVSWGIFRSADETKATYFFRGSAVNESARAEHAARAGEILLTEDICQLLQNDIDISASASFQRLSGFRLELPEPAPSNFLPVEVEISKLFMPEEVITQNLRSEFRQIVNLFIRFPELLYEDLQALLQIVFELHEKYGGLINRLDFGDKGCNMLMLWGAPVAHENDIGRALNFVLDLRARVDFPITAGVTYYVAHAGYLGSEMCEDYTCYGWGINLASRFMTSAPEDSIWIDERIARRVKNSFEFTFQGVLRFKGFAAEQKVFNLTARKSEELFHQGEFVGRELELPHLIDCIRPLWKGKFSGVTVIWGDAGIGKSRLVYELHASLLHNQKVLWALCHSDQILRHSFNPFRYWLIRYFEIDFSMDDAIQKLRFDSKLNQLIEKTSIAELADELNRVRTVLGNLLDLHWHDSFYDQLDAEGRYNNTLSALITLIKAESLQQPVIVFLEDAQFMDEDSRAFLPRLKAALTAGNIDYPAAILVSSRRMGVEASLDELLIDEAVDLGPLSTQALVDLAEIYLGGRVSPDLVRMLATRSEGNPYFAAQILIYLQEEYLLEMSDKGWRATRLLQEASLPADIRALLVARLDQLSRNVRDVILTASVLGREFWVAVLSEMLKDDEEDLEEDLTEAERARIWAATTPLHYMFTHGLLRDAAYAMQMRARRVELHTVALESLEIIYKDEVKHHYGELAHHAERARLVDKALYYLRLAGKDSTEKYQNGQAVDYYTRALAFVNPDDLATQYDLLAERVELYSRMGKRDLQFRDLDALERWADELGDPDHIARTLMLRAAYYYFIGDYLNSIESAKRAEVYPISNPNSELALYTQVVWGSALVRLGRLDEAFQRAQETLSQTQTAGNRKEEARILNVLGLVALEQKEFVLAQKCLMQALEIARDIKDPSLELRALNNLAVAEGSISGNYVLARKYYEESYEIAHKIGDRVTENNALSNIGFAAGMLGDFVAARSYREQALLLAREIGNRFQETYTLIYLSAISGLQNEIKLALQYAQQAADLAGQISERSNEGWAMLYLGHAWLLQPDLQMAETAYRKSIEIRHELNQPTLAMEPTAGLVETFLQANDIHSASRETEKILSFLESGSTLDGTDEPLRIYYACHRLLEQTADPRADLILSAANQTLEKQLSNFSDEDSRRRFIENFPWRRAIYMAGKKKEN